MQPAAQIKTEKKREPRGPRFFFTHTSGALHILFIALVALLVTSGCTSVRKNYPKTASYALPAPPDTSITHRIAAQLARRPAGQSGFRLLALSSEALTARIALADQAVSSLDVQYYMMHLDPTGRLVTQHLLDAADRGVRVRLLLDDIHAIGKDRDLLALDAHPNIEVRIFNPFKNRQNFGPTIATQFLLDGRRLNRRMHNKSFIVDSNVAIIGGRNIGDEYFDARQDVNFRDLDVITVGPIVTEIIESFDTFWNSPAAYPLDAFYRPSNSPKKLQELRATLPKNARPYPSTAATRVLFTREFALSDGTDDDEPAPDTLTSDPVPRFRWCWGAAQLIADAPQKADPDDPNKGPHIGDILSKIINTSQNELLLVSPYFVPRPEGVELLASLTARDVTVKVLTNSLASTDVSLVHAGYARYRPAVVAAGVELYELRALPAQKRKNLFRGKRSANISLHAKAFVIDRRTAFIGSMNIDPRSQLLNTEMGVLVDSPELARQLAEFFAEAIEPDSSYRVHLAEPDDAGNRKVYWTGAPDGKPITFKNDPNASVWRRMKTTFMRLFPIEGLL